MYQFKDTIYKLAEFKPAPEQIGFMIWKNGFAKPIGGLINEGPDWRGFFYDDEANGRLLEGTFDTVEEALAEVDKVYFLNLNYKQEKVVELDRYRKERNERIEAEVV